MTALLEEAREDRAVSMGSSDGKKSGGRIALVIGLIGLLAVGCGAALFWHGRTDIDRERARSTPAPTDETASRVAWQAALANKRPAESAASVTTVSPSSGTPAAPPAPKSDVVPAPLFHGAPIQSTQEQTHPATQQSSDQRTADRQPAAADQDASKAAPRPERHAPAQVAFDQAEAPPAKVAKSSTNGTPPTTSKEAAAAPQRPQFDVVRVEPSGDAVLAGRASPNAEVSATLDGKVIAKAKTDDSGQFAMTPPTIKPGNHILGLSQANASGSENSKRDVLVSVPKTASGQVVVATADHGTPEASSRSAGPVPSEATQPKVAAATTSLAEPAKPQAAVKPFAITSVEGEREGGFVARGTAPPGDILHLYLNDSHIADVTAVADGWWDLAVRRGLQGGHYSLRADDVGHVMTGAVIARREASFDVPFAAPATVVAASRDDHVASSAAAMPPAEESPMPRVEEPPLPAAPSTPPADATARAQDNPPVPAKPAEEKPAAKTAGDLETASVNTIDHVETAIVTRGDSLWRISKSRLGQGHWYAQIFTANVAQIRDPSLIYPGQIFVVPR